ncbi:MULTISPECIES: hypothetical protein [Ktedonobacter]|uniref:hypothetical protein n=1 Tax=Ktedonobacter TaxID=363276 RepID=UPI001916C8A2|nr:MULTISPECIES: hypothetical protein [Ktedonobacter]
MSSLFPKRRSKMTNSAGKGKRGNKKPLISFGRPKAPKTKQAQKKFLGIFGKGK